MGSALGWAVKSIPARIDGPFRWNGKVNAAGVIGALRPTRSPPCGNPLAKHSPELLHHTVCVIEQKLSEGCKPPNRGGSPPHAMQEAAKVLGISGSALRRRVIAAGKINLNVNWDLYNNTPPIKVINPPSPSRSTEYSPSKRHFLIPDTQVRPGVPVDHLRWVGQAIVDYRPDAVIHLGDHWDFPSLNKHVPTGHVELEHSRFVDDVAAGNEAFEMLCKPMEEEQKRNPDWIVQLEFLEGNHEERADRTANADPKWIGTVSVDACKTRNFKWNSYLKRVWLDGLCLQADHLALKANLEYCALRDLKIGDLLVAFEENIQGYRKSRRYKTAIVLAHKINKAPLYAVELSNGQVFRTTADHHWLVRGNSNSTGLFWCRTDQLKKGFGSPHLFDIWQRNNDYDSGWLGGLFDGEGCLSKPNKKQGGLHLSLAQNPGPTLERAKSILRAKGFDFSENQSSRRCMSLSILGPSSKKLRLIVETGAQRLIGKFMPEMIGRMQQPDNEERISIVKISACGIGEIAEIETSTGTMIVDGHPHHNCYSHFFQASHSDRAIGGEINSRLNKIGASFAQGHEQGFRYGNRITASGRTQHGVVAGSCYTHVENYRGAQGQRHWRGVVVLNEVRDGDYCIMPLTLDYLCRKYEGVPLHHYMVKNYPSGNWDHLA